MQDNVNIIKDPSQETTEIICVLDRSTSIRTSGLIEKTIEGFNSFLADQKKLPGKAKVTLCLFDGGTGAPGETYEIRHNGIDLKDVPELNKETFLPKGMTAMWDGIGMTLDAVSNRLEKTKLEEKPDKVVFLIMTDGQENSSREYTQESVQELIKKYKERDKWSFLFIGANIDTQQVGRSMGVTLGNTMSYSGSDRGVKMAFANMSKSVGNLRKMSTTSAVYAASLDTLLSDNGEDIFDSIFISEEQAERAFRLMIDRIKHAKEIVFFSTKDYDYPATRYSAQLTTSDTVCLLSCFKDIGRRKCTMSFHFDTNVMRVNIPYEKFASMYSQAILAKTRGAHSQLIDNIGNYNEKLKN